MSDAMARIAFFFIISGFVAVCNAEVDIYFVAQYKDGIDRYKRILNEPCVKGLTLYVAWERVEPSEGKIDISSLDAWLDYAERNHKKINIGVFAGLYAPEWLKQKTGMIKLKRRMNREQQSTMDSNLVTMPNPVAPVIASSIEPLLRDIAHRYKKNTAFGYMLITGANFTGFTTNISVLDSESEEKLIAQGFSPEAYNKNWNDLIKLYANIFPDRQLVLGVGPILGDSKINNNLVKSGYEISGNRFSIILDFLNSKWFLNTRKPEVAQLRELAKDYQRLGKVGLQMLWWESEYNLLGDVIVAIKEARDFGANWVEIWPQDFDKVSKEYCSK